MLELIICDDEKVYRNDLKRTLSTELDLSGIEYRICEFTSGEELLAKVSPADSQILFLDIEMADLNGIETAKKLRENQYHGQIIFVTSHPDFVFQGYEVRSLNYILKPYVTDKILSVLHTALNELDVSVEKYFIVEQRSGSTRVPLNDICYFFSEKRLIHLVSAVQTYTFYGKLNDLEEQLPDSFVRIHNRYLIHMKYLEQIGGTKAVVAGEALPVSRACKTPLSIAFAKYMLK